MTVVTSAIDITVIVVGSLVGLAVITCIVGTTVRCCIHVYKYWCDCLPSASPGGAAHDDVIRNPYHVTNDPTVLVVRALPPNYSTLHISCELADERMKKVLAGNIL